MNDALPLPNSYHSSFLEQIRRKQCSFSNACKNVTSSSGRQKKNQNGSSDANEGAHSDAPKTSSLRSKINVVKRCLFTERKKNKDIRFVKPTFYEKQDNKTGPGQKGKATLINLPQTVETSKNDFIGEWPANVLRFLLHNTYYYSILSLLLFVRDKGPVLEYHGTKICKDVFGEVSLEFLNAVYQYRIPLPSYHRRNRECRQYYGSEKKHCIACNKTGVNCDCPVIDESFYVYCKQPCPKPEFDCNKCKKWRVSQHVCPDFFFCETCDKYYKTTIKDNSYPSYCA